MPSGLPPPWKPHEDSIQINNTGQGDLFKVRRPDDDASYALKRLKNPARSARFKREVDAMRKLSASDIGIVPVVVESGTGPNGKPFYVMPWYEDGSLEDAVADGRFSDLEKGIKIMLKLIDALETLHLQQWAHRDLKPANVLIDGDDLMLCDLGLALPIDDEQDRLTESAEAVGSRYYIAPENESGISDEVDQRPADFYAFGKICWRVFTGFRTLAREEQLQHRNRIATLKDDNRLAAWDEVCDQLLNTDPRARLADWPTVRIELANVLAALIGEADEPASTLTRAESLTAAAARLTRSSMADEFRVTRASLTERQERVRELQQAAYDIGNETAPGMVDLNGLTGGLVQAYAGTNSAHRLEWLISAGALDGLPDLAGRTWAPYLLIASPALTLTVEGLIEPMPPSVHLAGYVLADEDAVWMLRVPFIWTTGPLFLPSLSARFRAVSGPYRLGLASTRSAARTLGSEVFEVGLAIAEEYVGLLTDGRPIDDPNSWIAGDQREA